MKGFVILLLGIIFVTLIAGSVQSISADHLESGNGIFKDENSFNLVSTKNSKYQVYLQVEVRNAQGQLISISEASHGKYIPHELTDNTFNEKLGKREIITIDNIEYEKVQYVDTLDIKQLMNNISGTSHYIGLWRVQLCGEVDGHAHTCVPVFQGNTSYVFITEDDVVTNQWTILRVMN